MRCGVTFATADATRQTHTWTVRVGGKNQRGPFPVTRRQ
jgi:hypothetical protein